MRFKSRSRSLKYFIVLKIDLIGTAACRLRQVRVPCMTGQVCFLGAVRRFVSAWGQGDLAAFSWIDDLGQQVFALLQVFGALSPVFGRSPTGFSGSWLRNGSNARSIRCNVTKGVAWQPKYPSATSCFLLRSLTQLVSPHVVQLQQALAFDANQIFQDVGLVEGHGAELGFRVQEYFFPIIVVCLFKCLCFL